ncbi:MAG TPA: energy-coupling factor ABC transporter ATP-binding protein [Candidatus Atopostipes pullistercoris]|uniref:Energy-coupling factor transporter ATP-binding protein EcfA2 n=1 Tax=Candidatus Atopostipes pullistercoris TaxID=2838467 RepID=A0A9D2G0Z1_9LACT|nr:energy-coupling factor ABC transporter ATP-binding protein [Candidatus Atopostipes pullistercoris]
MEIRFEDVNFTYQPGTPFENKVLHDINFTIKDGSYTAIVGHTGSGKSTILQHLNALKTPTSGSVWLGDLEVNANKTEKSIKDIRKEIGVVFQFPEAQLFEETVGKDIAFGPQNFGMSEQEALKRAEEILPVVGLDASFMNRSPFELSGGQMRRVAIAGVLVMEPSVLVLDEPTAGLDPKGQFEMMSLFNELHQTQNLTIVLVTHQMEDVANYADHMIVLDEGKIVGDGSPRTVFQKEDWLRSVQLDVPNTVEFAKELAKNPNWSYDELPLTLDELTQMIVKKINLPKKERTDKQVRSDG